MENLYNSIKETMRIYPGSIDDAEKKALVNFSVKDLIIFKNNEI